MISIEHKFLIRLNNKIYRSIYSLKRIIFSWKIALTNKPRPTSYPFISSDSFRQISDHIYDFVDNNSKVYNIKKNEIVFVNSDDIENFFRIIHPHITHPYILITHWGIKPVDTTLVEYIDDKIIHWFGKNVLIQHPKITPIPIGLEDLHRFGTGNINLYKKPLYGKHAENKILYHFKIATNPKERQLAYDYISKHQLAETLETKLHPALYLKELQKYKFVISPPGAGQECHRTWEAIYVGTVPIVQSSIAEKYFENIGVPIWVVNDWSELSGLTEKDLEDKYNKIINISNNKVIYMNYWIDKIQYEKIPKENNSVNL